MTPKHRPEPDPAAPDAARQHAVRVFQGFMARVQAQRVPAILEIGISMAQVKVLHAVFAAGRIHGSELAHAVGTTPSTVSGIVDRLVDHGLLARVDDPADRRQILISVTPAGIELVDRFRELNRNLLDSLLARISDQELSTVSAAFEILDRAVTDLTANASVPSSHPTDQPGEPSGPASGGSS